MVQIRRFQLIKLNSQYKHLPWIGLRSRKTVYPAIRTCQRLRTMFFAHYFFYCRTASNRSSPHSVWQSGSKTRHSGSRSRFRIKAAIRGAWLGWYDHERKPGEWRADFHGRYFWSLNLLHFRLVTICSADRGASEYTSAQRHAYPHCFTWSYHGHWGARNSR